MKKDCHNNALGRFELSHASRVVVEIHINTKS